MENTNTNKTKKVKAIIANFLKKMTQIETKQRKIEAEIQAEQDAEKIKQAQQKIKNA